MKKIKYSDILIEAKTQLRKPTPGMYYKSPYVCDAVMNAASKLRAVNKGLILTGKICLAINNHFSVRSWRQYEHNIDPRKLTERRLQEYRHRWLDHMIKTFKEAGQ